VALINLVRTWGLAPKDLDCHNCSEDKTERKREETNVVPWQKCAT